MLKEYGNYTLWNTRGHAPKRPQGAIEEGGVDHNPPPPFSILVLKFLNIFLGGGGVIFFSRGDLSLEGGGILPQNIHKASQDLLEATL